MQSGTEQIVHNLKKKKPKMLVFTASADSSVGLKKCKPMKKLSYKDLDSANAQWYN